MAQFSYEGRQYSAVSSAASNGQEILIMTNQDGVELTVKYGERRAVKKDQQGNIIEVDLQNTQYRDFYSGLIQEAQRVVEEARRVAEQEAQRVVEEARRVAEQEAQEKNEREADSFFKNIEAQYEEQVQNFNQTLNIAVIGNVSSGKSSLINALLMRTHQNALAR